MNTDNVIVVKPIIKWVGGKTQIIHSIINKFPTKINNYHELFLGGGSVLLALLSYIKHNKIQISGNITAYDLNSALIGLYKNIKSHPDDLYTTINNINNVYVKCNTPNEGDVINRKPLSIEDAMTSKESYPPYIPYIYLHHQYLFRFIDRFLLFII